jgi:transcriptional regulator with XRE-family HTH domain
VLPADEVNTQNRKDQKWARFGSAALAGKRLRTLREAANLTQKELADELSVSVRSVQAWEAGTSVPQARHRRRLAEFFSVSEADRVDTNHQSRGRQMSKRTRYVLGFAALAILVAIPVIAGVFATHGTTTASRLAKSQAQYGVTSAREGSEKASIFGEATGEDPNAAANEAYALNAYPADEIPFQATLNSIQAWSNVKAKGVGRGKNTPGQWTLAGPSKADFPAVLTFSGADYTTSGRITALAIDPNCSQSKCRVWAAAAGGGVWRTNNALSGAGTNWTFLSDSFATNAIGTLTYANGVLYAGTGEPNASGDSAAGMGLYKSTDGGDSWVLVPALVGPISTSSPGSAGAFPNNGTYTGNAFLGRSISAVVVDPTNPSHLWVASTRGVRGVGSVTSGATSNPPTPRPPYGLFESTNGGSTFTFRWDGSNTCPATCNGTSPLASVRGVNDVELDPGYNGGTNRIVYAAAFASGAAGSGGVWRSADGGTTWAQIKTAQNPALNTDRAEFAVTKLGNGNTRMYVGVGNSSIAAADQARLYRADDAVNATNASFIDLTAQQQASSAPNQTINYCGDPAVGGAQCWYDNVVYSPAGKPNVVYLGGSYSYTTAGGRNNGRAFIRSTDAGATFTDMTRDATIDPAPNGMHPDSHAIVEIPGTDSAIFGSDGGLVRTDGTFTDISSQCASRGLTGTNLATCQQLLSAVPSYIYSLNKGLSTLQFQSVRIAPDNPKHLQGGTQDNGTFETYGSAVVWPQIMYGDGGQSGFSADNSALRFNTFTGQASDVNFQNGDPTKWVIATGPIVSSPESSYFYPPVISDPVVGGTIFQGSFSVWRTQDWGGNQAFLEANCPEFTTSAANPACGDFVRIGPAGNTDLTAAYGGGRTGGSVAAIARTTSDTGTVWAATGAGRVFISHNADNPTASSVTWTRLDTLEPTTDPGRAISGIYVDPANSNHAWITYYGYNFNTPTAPGHIFSVTYDPVAGTATWTSIDGSGATAYPDFPANDVVYDSVTGDLYVANDFGVMRRASGGTSWTLAGSGMPMVETAGLSIATSARKLVAATHGRSAWQLTLP